MTNTREELIFGEGWRLPSLYSIKSHSVEMNLVHKQNHTRKTRFSRVYLTFFFVYFEPTQKSRENESQNTHTHQYSNS